MDKCSIQAYSGIVKLSRRDLEKLKAANQKVAVKMIGLLIIDKGVSPELAMETIKSIRVYGAVHASPKVKSVLRGIGR